MPPRVRSTARIPACRSRSIRMSIIRSPCMRRPRRRMSSWPIPIPRCTRCRPRACASSPSMGHGAGPTWPCSCSRPTSSPAGQSTCSTTAGTSAISPTSTTSRQGVVAAVDHVAAPDAGWNSQDPNPSTSSAPYRLYNIGNHRSIELLRYIEVLEHCLGRKAQKNLLPMQPGDVPDTLADVETLRAMSGTARARRSKWESSGSSSGIAPIIIHARYNHCMIKPVTDRKIRFALVGCGRIAANHIGAIKVHGERCELTDVCDVDPAPLADAVAKTGAKGHSEPRKDAGGLPRRIASCWHRRRACTRRRRSGRPQPADM